MHVAGRRRSAGAPMSVGWSVLLPAFFAGAFALLLQFAKLSVTSFFLNLIIYASFPLICFLFGGFVLLIRKSPPKNSRFDVSRGQSTYLLELFDKLMGRFSVPVMDSSQTRRVVVSHNVDKALKEVFDYSYRDFVLSWYAPLSRDEGQLFHMLTEDFWEIVRQLRGRLTNVDLVTLVCHDTVKTLHTHFCDLKAASARLEDPPKPFLLHPCLRSPEEEVRFLRCCARMLLLCLLPARDARSYSLRVVLVDLITAKVLKPLVEVLSDPDYINRMLLSQLEQRETQAEQQKRGAIYAASYEDFIKLISSSSDVDFLKQLRYQIVGEIIHATTISSIPQLKKQKERKGKEANQAMKADVLRARDTRRYINQLTVAKKSCEKRIRLLGGPHYEQQEDGATPEDGEGPKKILQFEDIMCNPDYRDFFRVYMERIDKRALISFWELVETLKTANKSEVPQLVGEIYQKFFVESREIVVDKLVYKEVQQTLVGNKGTDVFLRIQTEAYETMRERYYPSFLVCDLYDRLIKRVRDEQLGSCPPGTEDKEEGSQGVDSELLMDKGSKGINEQASYAATKLQQLYDKLEYKRQALDAIQKAPKPDKKIVSRLKEEMGLMEKEHSDLQLHISRTDWWCENLGSWRALITGAEPVEESGETLACYCVSVHLLDGDETPNSHWSVSRKLTEFQILHRKLTEYFPSLKKVQLPSLSKLPFKSIDQKFLEKSKNQLNTFLQRMLTDMRMCESEALYAFLSPSPEHLKVMDIQKKSSFSLASFLEKLPGDLFSHQEEEAEDDSDLSDYGDELDGKKDALAEPCFMLIGEIFELRGIFKGVRKTLIALVQVLFGRTINKQIRDTVNWIFSEQMLVSYINVFRDTFWPNGRLAPHNKARTDSECRETKERAQQKLLDNIPDALQNLVGQQNARNGIIKSFNALQETSANKHMIYVLLEILLKELCPELHMEQS